MATGSKLGGLPTLGYGPVLAEPAPVAKADTSGGIFGALADGAEAWAGVFKPAAEDEAAKQGAASITRDEQGNLKAGPDRPAFTDLDKAYENAAHLRYMAEAAMDIRPKIGDLMEQYKDDPNGFKVGLRALQSGATRGAPPQFQQPLIDLINQEGAAAQDVLVRQKIGRDMQMAQQSVDTLLTSHQNELAGYARQNQLDDPRAQVLMKEYTDAVRAKVANPAFAYSQAQADQDISEFQSQMKAQAIIGTVDKLYVQHGEKQAELEAEKLLDDPSLNLSPQERNTYAAQARQQIRILHAGTRDEQMELQRQVEYRLDDANTAALATGDYTKVVSDDEIMRAYAGNAPRAQQIISKLRASNEIYSMRKSVAMAPPAALADMENRYNPAKNGAGQTPTGFNSVWSQWMLPTEGGYKAHDGAGGGPLYTVGKPEGLLTPGNIDLNARPVVKNADGSISTVRSITIEDGGKAILIPTVVGNKVVSNADAISNYKKTGDNLGVFSSEKLANAYAEGLHEQQAKAYGSPVNFGINQGANPDVDVKNLTQSAAAKIAKDRYWTPSGAENLPPALAAVQFDTAMNMGVGTAKELLAKSNGDVRSYLDLREQKYRDIAAHDPAKAADLPGWLQRNEALRNFANGGNIADQSHIYSAFHEAVQQRNQALSSDPAGYVLANRQDIGTLLSSKDPAAVQNGVRQLLSVQRDLGTPVPDVLDKAQTQVVVAEFNNPSDPEHRAQGMNDVINGLETRFGQYFPQVMTELTRKGMPDEAYALLLTRGDPGTASRMANAIDNRKALDKLMEGNPDKKSVDDGVRDNLADLGKTVSAQGNGAATMARLTSAARLYAYQLVQEGVSADKAASTAAHDVISQHYTVQGTYRVPNGIDASAVSAGAEAFQRSIGDRDLAPMGSLATPNTSAETKQQMTAQVARRKAIWVTTPDESGLQLVWPMELGYAPLRDNKGQVIRRTWGQLQAGVGGGVQAPTQNDTADALLRSVP